MDTPYWDGVCEIKDCAMGKDVEDCSYCKNFPCELLLDISLDPDTGDDGERLDRLRLKKDAREDGRIRVFRMYTLGGTIGAVGGLLAAGITGGGLNWFYALGGGDYHVIPESPDGIWGYILFGTGVGLLIPIIIEFIKRYNKNG
jgi:hypothetical protein